MLSAVHFLIPQERKNHEIWLGTSIPRFVIRDSVLWAFLLLLFCGRLGSREIGRSLMGLEVLEEVWFCARFNAPLGPMLLRNFVTVL